VFDVTTVDITVLDMLFRATGRIVKFDGFMALYTEGKDDRTRAEQEEDAEEGRRLPELAPGALLLLLGLLPGRHFTEPPARYTEATLVRALEERGIGRPSTYAQILSTIVERGYVLLEEKRFRPTGLGCIVNDQLVRHFPDVVNVDFTARVEQQLDDVAQGGRDWADVLRAFYDPFQRDLARAEAEMERVKPEAVPTETPCPECGRMMVIRSSRYGKFLGCSGFPECKHTMPLEAEGKGDAEAAEAAEAGETMSCPACGRPMRRRTGRFGEFWGCTGYPECRAIVDPKKKALPPPDPEFRMPCPRAGCGGVITAKRSRRGTIFYSCSNYAATPRCEYVAWSRPDAEQQCQACGFPTAERAFRGVSQGMRCTNAECPAGAAPGGARRGRRPSGARRQASRAARKA
jgi:DNA topoisomerase-1